MAIQPEQPFSRAWVVASVVIITTLELLIALALAPAILTGALASEMLRMRLEILMHLASFYLGGLVVGILSPGVRLNEPAVGAFISVMLVFLTSFFLPHRFLGFSVGRLLIGGGIAFGLAMMGAYTGERWMGNVQIDKPDSARAGVRRRLWGDAGHEQEGLLSRRRERERR